jgi:hypothetical protein
MQQERAHTPSELFNFGLILNDTGIPLTHVPPSLLLHGRELHLRSVSHALQLLRRR